MSILIVNKEIKSKEKLCRDTLSFIPAYLVAVLLFSFLQFCAAVYKNSSPHSLAEYHVNCATIKIQIRSFNSGNHVLMRYAYSPLRNEHKMRITGDKVNTRWIVIIKMS